METTIVEVSYDLTHPECAGELEKSGDWHLPNDAIDWDDKELAKEVKRQADLDIPSGLDYGIVHFIGHAGNQKLATKAVRAFNRYY